MKKIPVFRSLPVTFSLLLVFTLLLTFTGIFACAEGEAKEITIGSTTVSSAARSIRLSNVTDEDAAALIDALPEFTGLATVNLGSDEEVALSWESIAALEEAAPGVRFQYKFTLYGKSFSLSDTTLDLNHIKIEDDGALVRQVIACMPYLKTLDMDFCGVDNEHMAAIRDDFPDIKVIWRVWFGTQYSVRTDVEKILASQPSNGGMIYGDRAEGLKYCTDVKYLDIGHNEEMRDIEFVSYMPKLEVLIMAMSKVTDLTPLASCPNLEYLEVQTTRIDDLTPLSGLTKLRHLNICTNIYLKDITPIYTLTGLERLWIGCVTKIPEDQIAHMQELAPNCVINTTAVDPHDGWRWGNERYDLLIQQFGYDTADYSFSWKDPLYNPHD